MVATEVWNHLSLLLGWSLCTQPEFCEAYPALRTQGKK
ncbi:hypothetical protein SPONN_2789 [uncultured Candidatus Thioglobus sp.]|nr:hypothetical protein SPONN_2789 [uncultured Candidatus Thioglobus sp.]